MTIILPVMLASLTTLSASLLTATPTTTMPIATIEETRPLVSEQDQWKIFLSNQLEKRGYGAEDYQVLHAIIRCESGWRQYNADGSVLVSKTNDTGLGQINRYAHEKTYTAMGIDPRDPFQNLMYVLYLYERNGISDWHPYSGKCWDPDGRILQARLNRHIAMSEDTQTPESTPETPAEETATPETE